MGSLVARRHWTPIAGMALLFYWLALVAGTHYPFPHGIPTGYTDKQLHFAGYAGLAFLAMAAWSAAAGLSLAGGAIVWLVAVAHGALDEITQPPFGRTCDVWDWVADVVGVSAGLLLFVALAITLRAVVRRRADILARKRAAEVAQALVLRQK